MALQYNLDETEAQCRQPRGLPSLIILLNDVGADIAEQLKVYSLDTLSESQWSPKTWRGTVNYL